MKSKTLQQADEDEDEFEQLDEDTGKHFDEGQEALMEEYR